MPSRPPSLHYLPPFVAALLVLLSGCATPVPPSGGPVDRTPPEIVSSDPEPESVNVEDQTVSIEFSEWVDQRSFENALSVTPEPEGRLSFRWRRRTVEITFPEPLRPNTTYVLTIGTDFRDHGGTRLTSPITLAFSTGPTINRGRISGTVVGAQQGRPVSDINVYAYAGASMEVPPPDSLPPQSAYRTQTGTDGRFQFEYLSEIPFYVVALRDANRNRRADPGEAYAVPPRPWIVADSSGTSVDRPWIVAVRDTIPPELTRARPLSNRRVELRYTEPIILIDVEPGEWTIADSASGDAVPLQDVYQRVNDLRSVFVTSESALPPRPHRLISGAVADSSGNLVRNLTTSFTPSATEDTVSVRFTGFVPDTTDAPGGMIELLADQVPAVRFSAPPSETQLRSWVTVVDTAAARTVSDFRTSDGTTFGLRFEPTLDPGDSVMVEVALPEASYRQNFRRLALAETGEISGIVSLRDTLVSPAIIELYEAGADVPLRQTTASADDTFVFSGLPEGTYRMRAFADVDESGAWTGGSIAPYSPAEPLLWWNEEVTVRPRWETALPDTLFLPPRPSADRPSAPLPSSP